MSESGRYLHALNDQFIDVDDLEDIFPNLVEPSEDSIDQSTYLNIQAETKDGKIYDLNHYIKWSNTRWAEDCEDSYVDLLCESIRESLKPGEAVRTYSVPIVDIGHTKPTWPWVWAIEIEKAEV
jgi:hypothetical protein